MERCFAGIVGQAVDGSSRCKHAQGHQGDGSPLDLYGLRLGDPVYLLGATKPRPATELQAEGLDGTLGNSTIEVWGNEDAPGMKCTLMRGSELSNVGKSRSGVEMLSPKRSINGRYQHLQFRQLLPTLDKQNRACTCWSVFVVSRLPIATSSALLVAAAGRGLVVSAGRWTPCRSFVENYGDPVTLRLQRLEPSPSLPNDSAKGFICTTCLKLVRLGYHRSRHGASNTFSPRSERSWVTVRSDRGGVSFMLHDGTGGIKVNLTSFKRIEYGQMLKRWSGAFAESLGKQLMAQAAASMLRGTRVTGHRWTLYGLRLGDPVYLLGATKPRPATELQAEGLDGTLGNSTIEVWGNEDAPGMKCTLMRGSELSNVGKSRSGVEMLVPPIVLLLGGLSLFGLA